MADGRLRVAVVSDTRLHVQPSCSAARATPDRDLCRHPLQSVVAGGGYAQAQMSTVVPTRSSAPSHRRQRGRGLFVDSPLHEAA